MSDKNTSMEEGNHCLNNDEKKSVQFSEEEIAFLKKKWKTINTSTTPEMLSMNTSGSKDFDRFVKNIKLEGI